jgi:hypothetical protein
MSDFISDLEHELRAASTRRMRLAAARGPFPLATVVAVVLSVAVCIAVAGVALTIHAGPGASRPGAPSPKPPITVRVPPARVHDPVLLDCLKHGSLTGRYTAAQLRHALTAMPASVREYTNCTDEITTALHQTKVLRGDGIGNIQFGQAPTAAVHSVQQLLGLGRPTQATATSPTGYTHFGCGFYQVYWTGLAETPMRVNHSAGLTLWFKQSRFAGYTYGSPEGGRTTPVITHGPRFSTAEGLGLMDPLSRARQLYGNAFVITSTAQGTPPNPRLPRLPTWELQTVSGRISGFIDNPAGPRSAYRGTIGTIQAGATPNTPCR